MIKKIGLIIAILFFLENLSAQTLNKKEVVKIIIPSTDTIESTYPEGLKGFQKFLIKI